MTFHDGGQTQRQARKGTRSVFLKDVLSGISAVDQTCDWTTDGLPSRPTRQRTRVSEETVDICFGGVTKRQKTKKTRKTTHNNRQET